MAAGAIRYFEDVTGNLTTTIYRDAHSSSSDANVRVSPIIPGLPEDSAVIEIKADHGVINVLDFAASTNSLGTVSLSGAPSKSMESYLYPKKNKRG